MDSFVVPKTSFKRPRIVFFDILYFTPPIKTLSEKVSPKPLNHSIKTLKSSSNRLQFTNKCSTVSSSPQNSHPPLTAGSRRDTHLFVAIAPLIILHCRSPDRFSSGHLYRDLRWSLKGKFGPKLLVHFNGCRSFSATSWTVLTHRLYKTFLDIS